MATFSTPESGLDSPLARALIVVIASDLSGCPNRTRTTHDLGQRYAKSGFSLVHNDNFAAGDHPSVHHNIHRLTNSPIKRNHGTASQLDESGNGHCCRSKYDLDGYRNAQNDVQISVRQSLLRCLLGPGAFIDRFLGPAISLGKLFGCRCELGRKFLDKLLLLGRSYFRLQKTFVRWRTRTLAGRLTLRRVLGLQVRVDQPKRMSSISSCSRSTNASTRNL